MENIERKNSENTWKNQFLKVENSLLELEKRFIEMINRELKDSAVKIKIEIEELFLKPDIVSTDGIDKFEQKRNEENKTN